MNHLTNHPTEIILLVFAIITFLQSGLDKIFDWNGNLSWLKGHFSESPFKNIVPILLATITLIEVIASALCVIGMIQLISSGTKTMALYGAILSSITLLMLLFGQRIAKDYVGAQTIVIYLIPTVALVYLLKA
ncbi:DoxX family protein [Aurantibacter crassamenti]|uniref:DoxX family protein n=1 Tax=Aurantibacter crassamenti TaxID=1837375 RepID=UPI001939FF8F|nr:DoxX family protein [Aurantibacter crassamenti]MBM1105236.1 DoxX family protein [Aurantibacter crassamenti]